MKQQKLRTQRTPVNKNDDLTLTIEALTGEGQGVARVDGYAVFVPGALIGETVEAHVIKATASYAVAKLRNVLSAAHERVGPRCAVFGRCGGCAMQHLSYAGQLAAKQRQVSDALTRLGGLVDPPMRPILCMDDPWRYRNKGSFPFGAHAGAAVFGFYAGRSHRLVPLYDCPIQDERIVDIARRVAGWADEAGVAVYDEQTCRGTLRHVMARALTTGETMAVVVTNAPLGAAQSAALVSALAGVDSVWHNLNPRATNVIFGERFSLLAGKPALTEVIGKLRFSVSPQSFLQINAVQAEALYEAAVSLLDPQPDETVVDAYCGIGTISLMLAARCKRVIGIEQVSAAVEDARQNAADNSVSNATFLCGDTEAVLPKLVSEGSPLHAILLDPPRKGCDERALAAVVQAAPQRIVYVSCNPATLARDLKYLCAAGYALSAVQPVDMFPQTSHVETIVLLSHKSPDSVINVKVEFGEGEGKMPLDAIAERAKKYQPKPKITYKMIQEYVEKKYGFKVHTAYIAEVKRSLGLTLYDAPNAVDELRQSRKHPPKEKIEAITDALKYFEVI